MGRITALSLAALLGTPDPALPAYRWLAETLRSLIANGRILHGTVLPSERDAVAALGFSRTTVTRGYALLRDFGYAVSKIGSGTLAQVPGGPIAGGGEPLAIGGFTTGEEGIDLTCSAPQAPAGIVDEYARALELLPAYASTMGYFPLGIDVLRQALADDYTRRGAPTGADQIIITTGALSGVATAARAVLSRGSKVLAESPTYPNSLLPIKSLGARIVPLPISPAGSDLDQIAAMLHSTRAAAMLCLPDFHNPVGTLLDNAGRERWAAELDAAGTVGIVDETNAGIWLDERPGVLPMAAFSKNLITVGSASKSHWGGLRLGWIRAPRHLLGALGKARLSTDLGAPVLEQLVLANLVNEGKDLGPAGRQRLRENRDWMLEQISTLLPDWRVDKPAGGLSLWCQLPAPRSTALAREVKSVLLAPGSSFAVEGHGLEHWVRLPYAQERSQLELALPAIAEAWGRAS